MYAINQSSTIYTILKLLNNLFKSYIGIVHYSTDDNIFFGKFEGESVNTHRQVFQDSVEDYFRHHDRPLTSCAAALTVTGYSQKKGATWTGSPFFGAVGRNTEIIPLLSIRR